MRTEILVTGSDGLLGHALKQICPEAVFVTRKDCDLTDTGQVERLFETLRPKCVLHLAAQVGGVKINSIKNAGFFEANVRVNMNVLSMAQRYGVSRLVSLLSGCAFQFYSDRPSTEEDLHVGLPFEGSLGYGYSKRALDVQTRLLWQQYGCEYSSITPVTMYGPNDNWDLDEGHVVGSLIHKCFLAKQQDKSLEVWGTGNAVRQFVYSCDVARVLLEALDSFHGPETTVVAPDTSITIRDLANLVAQAMKFNGPIVFDSTQPEGELVRIMKSNRFSDRFPNFSFTSLREGLKTTVEWFCTNYENGISSSPLMGEGIWKMRGQ